MLKKELLQKPVTAMSIREQKEKTKLKKKNGKENKCTDTASNKLVRLHIRRPG